MLGPFVATKRKFYLSIFNKNLSNYYCLESNHSLYITNVWRLLGGMNYKIRAMTLADYDVILKLWNNTEHVSLNECDTREGIELYINRNPGLCFVAEVDGEIIGAVLCGHDGRRGFLRHLAVEKSHRKNGIAQALINEAMNGLSSQGIGKCNIFVLDDNIEGLKFWRHNKWIDLEYDFRMLQIKTKLA